MHNAKRLVLFSLSIVVLCLPAYAEMAAQAERDSAPPLVEPALPSEHASLTVGLGVSIAPRYSGADRWQLLPAPILSAERGPFFVDTVRGMGLQYESSSKFYVSQSFYYDPGRLDRDSYWRPGSSSLAGMGNVSGSPTSRTIIAQQLTPSVLVSAETEMALRASAGRNRYRTGFEFTPLKTASDTVTIDLDAWWGDARYNAAYFGVTRQQAARTALRMFAPGAGMYAQIPSMSWEHRLDPHWSLTLQMTATHYPGKTGSSPVVAQRSAATATTATAYAF